MSCEVLTTERLEALLAGRLEESSTAELRAHFADPCEACLDRLATVEGTAILHALAGPAAKLEPAEAQRMFAAAHRATIWARGRRFIPLAVAAGLLLFLVARSPFGPIEELGTHHVEPSERLKGPNDSTWPSIQLLGLRGHLLEGRPAAGARIEAGSRLLRGERVLFRYRISQPAFVYWFVEHADAVEVLHAPVEGAAPTTAGEHELAEGGQVLALDPGPFAPRFRVIVAACSSPRPAMQIIGASDEVARAVGCGMDALPLEVSAE